MARNKITFEKYYGDDHRWTYRFIGSQRQPTLDEIEEFIVEAAMEPAPSAGMRGIWPGMCAPYVKSGGDCE